MPAAAGSYPYGSAESPDGDFREPITVTFSGEALAALSQLSTDTGKNVGEVLREAIALARWYQQVRQSSGRVLVDRGGKIKELVRV